MASEENMTFKLYQNRANLFVKEYLLADSLIPYTSIISGMLVCKMVFDLTQLIGSNYFKIYSSFSKVQRIEWNNRAASTTHAIFITTISLYFVFCSNLFWDSHSPEFITVRSSSLSTFALGASVGYFVSDLGMILWFFPSLGGYEYVIHHLLSLVAVAYAMFSGEGQLYTFMVLISETTTPGINLRCWNEKVQSLSYQWDCNIHCLAGCQNTSVHIHVLPRLLALSSGRADAALWADTSCCCASGAISYELGLVCEDYQRLEEDIGKETVK
ncbi:uncharacterized protein [Phaseolus vulgaris]|uniref:uncharacterized protein isoform X2 n=1 Tax=Phaseolus vulgaris TaxID=3885 RepID=UPI0035CA945A